MSTYCTQRVPRTVDLGGNQYESRDNHSARSAIEIRSAPSLASSWPDDIIKTGHDIAAIFHRDTTLSPTFTFVIKHVTKGIITNDGHSHSLLPNSRLQIHPNYVQIPVMTSKKTHCFSTSTNNQYKFPSFYTSRIVCIFAFGVVTLSRCRWKYTGLFISPSGISELDCATPRQTRQKGAYQ